MSASPTGPGGADELASFRAEVRAFVEKHRPAPPAFKLPQSFLEVESERQLVYLRDWQKRLYEAGYLGFDVPAAYGGRGPDPARHGVVMQELARAKAPFLVNAIGLFWAGPTILAYGTEEQKQRYLRPILSCDEIWCQGFSEPGAGSDLASLTTRAVRTDDGYVVSGHKVWTTLAHFASFMILLARTDPAAGKYPGLSYLLFPMKVPGVTVQPLVKMTGEGGFNQVIFDEAKAPLSSLLGREGQGWEIAMTTLLFERSAVAGSERDPAAQLLSALTKLATLAKRARRGKGTVADDAVFRDRIARTWVEIEALRASARRARLPELVAERPLALPLMAKLVSSEHAQRVAELACEVLGPDAALWLGDAHAPDAAEWPRAYMNSFGYTIGGGTSEIQRNILGERVLGLPKSK